MKGTLIKRRTDDGLMEVNDDVPLGKVYDLRPGTIHRMWMFNAEKGTHHEKEVVETVAGDIFPTELLELSEVAVGKKGPRYVIVHSDEPHIRPVEDGVGSPAHAFGPFDSAEEAQAFEDAKPDECYKFAIAIVGPDPDDIDRARDDDDEPSPPRPTKDWLN